MSKHAISRKYKIPVSTVQYLSDRLHLTDKTIEDYRFGLLNHIDITSQLKEILDGCIIGDGCYGLAPSSRCAQLAFQSKSRGLSEYLLLRVMAHGVDGHVAPTTQHHWRLMTLYYKEFKDQEKRWYVPAGAYERKFFRVRRKIVPRDINLSAMTCLLWYLGDGSLDDRDYITVRLHTESFLLEEVERLKEKILSQIGIRSTIIKENKPPYRPYYVLSLFNKNAKDFLSYIGRCPVRSMNYRWPKEFR